jgi:hypothetical protein
MTEPASPVLSTERKEDGAFPGFTGLACQTFAAHFTPCVEVGWRFDRFAIRETTSTIPTCRKVTRSGATCSTGSNARSTPDDERTAPE